MEFTNLPGIYAYRDDGNLAIIESLPGNVTLVIGTAPAGPMRAAYVVTDTVSAEMVFDPTRTKTGTLIPKMYEALASGSQYVVLYRIGAAPAILGFVNGYKISTFYSDALVGSKYKIYYSSALGELVISRYEYGTQVVVYDLLEGVDNGEVIVEGAAGSATLTIGTASVPVAFNAVNYTTTTMTIASVLASGNAVTGCGISNATKTTSITKSNETFAAFSPGQLVMVSSVASASQGGVFEVLYSITGELKLSRKVFAISATNYVPVTSTWTAFGAVASDVVVTPLVTYMPPTTGIGSSYRKLYEECARAYWELEGAKIDTLIVPDIVADAPNLVDWLASTGNLAVPTSNGVALTNFLGKVYQVEKDGQLFFAWLISNASIAAEYSSPFEMGINGKSAENWITGRFTYETAIDVSTTTSSAVDITFNETNFAHQMAEYLYNLSTNDNDAVGVISTTRPASYNKADIFRWLGKAPTYDAITGLVSASGSGVLGNPYKVGSFFKDPGFFHTSTEFPDGTVLVDTNNKTIDIGRYIVMTTLPVGIRSRYDGTATGYVTNGEASYAGHIMSTPYDTCSYARKIANNMFLPIGLAKKYLDQLTGAGYVTFSTLQNGDVKAVDAPTCALPSSDWNRLSSMRTTGLVLDTIRTVAEPFMGKITNNNLRDALQSRINDVLKDGVGQGFLSAALATIKATREMEIRGEAVCRVQLVTGPELRRLTIYVALMK